MGIDYCVAAYFAFGATKEALKNVIVCGVFGVAMAWIAAVLITTIPAGSAAFPINGIYCCCCFCCCFMSLPLIFHSLPLFQPAYWVIQRRLPYY